MRAPAARSSSFTRPRSASYRRRKRPLHADPQSAARAALTIFAEPACKRQMGAWHVEWEDTCVVFLRLSRAPRKKQ